MVSQYIILRSRFSLVAILPPFGGRVNEHSEEQSEDRHSEYSTLWRDKSTLNQPDPAHWRVRFQEWVTTRYSLLRATATAIAEAHFLAMDREIAFLRLGCRSMRFLKSQIIVTRPSDTARWPTNPACGQGLGPSDGVPRGSCWEATSEHSEAEEASPVCPLRSEVTSRHDLIAVAMKPLTPDECARLRAKAGYRIGIEIKPGMPMGTLS